MGICTKKICPSYVCIDAQRLASSICVIFLISTAYLTNPVEDDGLTHQAHTNNMSCVCNDSEGIDYSIRCNNSDIGQVLCYFLNPLEETTNKQELFRPSWNAHLAVNNVTDKVG